MEFFTVDENNKVIKEICAFSSERYEWLRKNRKIFNTEDAAYRYIDEQLKSGNREMEIKNKLACCSSGSRDDFNKMFDLNMSEGDYIKIKEIIDVVLK